MAEKIDNPLVYGPNTWLIDEMYRQFREDPSSVGEHWRDFFADYHPTSVPVQRDNVPGAPAGPSGDGGENKTTRDGTEEKKPESPVLPEGAEKLRGPAEIVVTNMEQSLHMPTATSSRVIPVKLLEENRRLINRYLEDTVSGKVSFTHLIAWSLLKAMKAMPAMTYRYLFHENEHYRITPGHINLGLAVDVQKKDGSRGLLVPNIKDAEQYDFGGFFAAYNELLRRVNTGKITPDDFMGTTATITNPGMIGTVFSIPRLMQGQSAIFGIGNIAYPPEYQDADPRTLATLGISKTMTVTSTYDHRVIQGAESGMFLDILHKLLTGADGFYEEIFENLRIPYHPVKLIRDINPQFDGPGGSHGMVEKQSRVLQLINMYRVRGHLQAYLNPLQLDIEPHSELDPEQYDVSLWDYDREFLTLGLAGRERMKLRDILEILRETYCRTIGIEYMHIQDPAQKKWIQDRVEGKGRSTWLDTAKKVRVLGMLNAAEAFEKFLHTKYIGHKRFSLEGAETLIPLLDALLNEAVQNGVEDVVMGMAHRGRLNVLANILGKSYERIFSEFDGDLDPDSMQGSGDVKYHLGASGTYASFDGKTCTVTLASNPSHLEAVDPVVEGIVRAMQDMREDLERNSVLPVLIHGDAAFAGQGVVAETLNLSALKGYRTGGTIHIVVNNGIGFTTSPADARSSQYATDVAKMVQAPIFHVNGEDPEAAVRVIELAFAFRSAFKKDVVVDMICYRKHGHNEGDDPSYTQPLMYSKIKNKRSVRKLYTEALVNRGDITIQEAENALDYFHASIERAFDSTKEAGPPDVDMGHVFREIEETVGKRIDTGVEKPTLEDILHALTTFPADFTPHPKLKRLIEGRIGVLDDGMIDWATGEALGFGSLLLEGIPVRLSGQDSRRGTFSHRHSVLVDYENGSEYIPLNSIRPGQAQYTTYDSLLSEYAVLGFEYGYSVARKNALVIWEAQFGDFVNGGQIITDQFIAAAEDKWGQQSGLVLLLPHGYEGQGPEHSSARLERFLILCAENNMRITAPTTSAQYFHLLRRQALLKDRKPLVVLTPKSLLRADVAKSSAGQFTEGRFNFILDDPHPPKDPKRILLCSGKVSFDLLKYRDDNGIDDTAIVRLEQLYPFPHEDLKDILKRYPHARDIRWVQEEPRNMGAWNFVYGKLGNALQTPYHFNFVGRVPSGSPAAGSATIHDHEQKKLIREAFE
ncbi:MAG: multifunctional oxoglutarate decarboxylase/oxoglutarate dehydrogenase thiamine pyrophosphate-binding subunit/dihydrolipoyllysine-residue succinyltransferase subunit [Bacteroidetes bacterium]|nr:multifunctional oxoglutarate decarboxylase/oxoglutarate dehydrogenase thiamine pyrophosphate-binding subunit/dihydrolipoyllysine-residue succinyltransferase subunit [Bacteroidota bacterium]